jgi:hypothetical protein
MGGKMKKTLLTSIAALLLATGTALVPASADYITCSPKDGADVHILNSPHPNDLNKRSPVPGLSWGFIVKRAVDELHFQGDLVTPRGGVAARNVWIITTE